MKEQQRLKIHEVPAKELLVGVGGEGWVVLDG